MCLNLALLCANPWAIDPRWSMVARSTPKPPFWQSALAPQPRQRLRGSHAELLAAAEDRARVVPYVRTQRCNLGELVLHPTFGLGVAVEVPGPGRVTVREYVVQ